MAEHLPILQIIVPLMAALLCVLLRHRTIVHIFSVAVCWTTFAISVILLSRVLDHGAISYMLGNWAAPWGIEYRLDVLGGFLLLFVSGMGALVLTSARWSLADELPFERHYLFHVLYLLCLSGLLGIVITGDLFNLFVFLEISSLSTYALIALGRDRRALRAAFQYLIFGTIGATFILIAIGLLYQMTGTLNMADMAERLGSIGGVRTLYVAFAFMSVGICLKIALYPLHFWLPNAYTYAPSVVTAFLASTATKVAVYILLRFIFSIFRTGMAFEAIPLGMVFMPLALAGIFIPSLVAIFQNNIKKMLAYSSISQIGYIILGIGFSSVTGMTGAIVHLFNHALMKGTLFLAMACIAQRLGSVDIEDMRGIGRSMPLTMSAWTIGGLGMIGVPLTAGFVSKWYLVAACFEQNGFWPLAILIVLGSLLSVVYIWRVVEVAYFREPSKEAAAATEAPLSILVPTWIMAIATLLFGIWTSLSVNTARLAAESLLAGGGGL